LISRKKSRKWPKLANFNHFLSTISQFLRVDARPLPWYNALFHAEKIYMALGEIEQIKKFIEDKKHILIVFGDNHKEDLTCAAVALSQLLNRRGKAVDIVSDDYHPNNKLSFLKGTDAIRANFAYLQKYVITLNLENTGIEELSYDVKDDHLRIFVTPKKNFFTKEDLRTAQSDYKYDAIISLGTTELSALGKIYEQNTELYSKKPVLNIDCNPANEYYGHINLIDPTASSISELIFCLIEKIYPEKIDAEIATILLTGMIIRSESFKAIGTNPETLNNASRLIRLGANREKIIERLYRTKSVSTLKLWGTALTHIESFREIGLVTTSITREDFIRSGTDENHLSGICEELIATAPEAKTIALVYEPINQTYKSAAIIIAENNSVGQKLGKELSAVSSGTKIQAKFENETIKEAQEKIINCLKKLVQ